MREAVRTGITQFKARPPLTRGATGFTSVFWVFLYLAPLVLAGAAAWLVLVRLQARIAVRPGGFVGAAA